MKLISAFVFATRIVQSLYFLNLKFPASSHLLWLYSLVRVRVGPGRKPRTPVFSQRGLNDREYIANSVDPVWSESKVFAQNICLIIQIHYSKLSVLAGQESCHIQFEMSHVTRKTALCICENKGPDQLCSHCCFRYKDSAIHLLSQSNISISISTYLLGLYSPVCAGPRQKTQRQVFLQCSSNVTILTMYIFEVSQSSQTNKLKTKMSRNMRKPTMWFLTRSDTNQAVQPMKIARGLKFRI